MNNYQILEIGGVIAIIVSQVYIFRKTLHGIHVFKNIFPPVGKFQVNRFNIKKAYFNQHPKDILHNLPAYIAEYESDNFERTLNTDDYADFDIVIKQSGGNRVTDNIIYSINTYLIRNRGAASDFNLLKDIVTRNCDVSENNISQAIPLPLYLGLLGTFLGIVIGLFQISALNLSDSSALDNAISLLLGGVEIAMVASFLGLLLMIIHSGYFFKEAKEHLEANKNDFYTFLQVDLLPVLNQSINSTLTSLQNNLHKFNEEFKWNIGHLNGVMGKNYDALIAQEKVLSALEELDITEFAKANVKVLQELKVSVGNLTDFNRYLNAINAMVSNTEALSSNVASLMQRTDNFSLLSQKIVASFEENYKLQQFLQDHYASLDESKQLISKSVSSVNNTLDESLDQLKLFTQEKVNEIRLISLNSIDMMQENIPEQWKELSKLKYLEKLESLLLGLSETLFTQHKSMCDSLDNIEQYLKELHNVTAEKQGNLFSQTIKWLRKKT